MVLWRRLPPQGTAERSQARRLRRQVVAPGTEAVALTHLDQLKESA
jgi:hypothetical protein